MHLHQRHTLVCRYRKPCSNQFKYSRLLEIEAALYFAAV